MKTVGDLRKFLESNKLSPEEAASKFHVSNMTIRRLLKKKDGDLLNSKYQTLFYAGEKQNALKLATETSFDFGDRSAWENSLSHSENCSGFDCVLEDLKRNGQKHSDTKELQSSFSEKIKSQKFSEEILELLREVSHYALTGSNLSLKLICAGALFYFVNVLDLIPDTLGPIGYLDDFAVVALVAKRIRNEPDTALNGPENPTPLS